MRNEMIKIYQLYYDKKAAIIKVSLLTKALYNTAIDKRLANQPQDYIDYYNNNYFVSLSRKALVQKAREMKEEWVKEAESNLELYKNIKI